MVDPRDLYRQMDSELLALWCAHFALKNNPANSPQASSPSTNMIDNDNVDVQVSECERMLM